MADAVSTIIDAITAGAATGASAAASDAVQTSYKGFLSLLRRRFSTSEAGTRELERVIEEPEADDHELRWHLRSGQLDEDSELVEVAATVLRLLSENTQSRYTITAQRVQGVVQGDNNDVRMKFLDD